MASTSAPQTCPALRSAEQEELELAAAELVATPELRAITVEVARFWKDAVRPSDELLAAFETEFEQATFCGVMDALNEDPLHPKIHAFGRFPHRIGEVAIPGTKAGHPCPDYVYRFIPVDGESHYLIHGEVDAPGPTAAEFSLLTAAQISLGNLSLHELEICDGRFTISVDPLPAAGRKNHLKSAETASRIIIRDVLGDVTTRNPHRLRVERTGPPVGVPPRSRNEVLAACRPALFRFCGDLAKGLPRIDAMTPNEFPSPALHREGESLISQAYATARIQLGPEDAIVLRLSLGDFAYATVPITNRWGGIGDFLDHIGALGTGRARPNPDGSYSFAVARRDPGIYNWVDLGDHSEGISLVRWVGRSGTPTGRTPTLESKVVKLDAVDGVLPAGVPRVDAAGRAAQRAAHRSAYLRVMG